MQILDSIMSTMDMANTEEAEELRLRIIHTLVLNLLVNANVCTDCFMSRLTTTINDLELKRLLFTHNHDKKAMH